VGYSKIEVVAIVIEDEKRGFGKLNSGCFKGRLQVVRSIWIVTNISQISISTRIIIKAKKVLELEILNTKFLKIPCR